MDEENFSRCRPGCHYLRSESAVVYVANHAGKTATLMDPLAQEVVGTIAFRGEPEYPQTDPQSGLIYQNLEDTSELLVIDPQKQIVVNCYKIDPGEDPPASHSTQPITASNRKLIVLNADTGNTIAVLPIGASLSNPQTIVA